MFQPNPQLVVQTKGLTVQDPATLSYGGQINSGNIANGGENGAIIQAESVSYSAKKLEMDMQMIGKRIKQHEENIKFLNTHKNSIDDSILDMQVMLGKYHSSSAPKTEGEDISNVQSEEETAEQILRHEKSAASVLCQLKTRHGTQAIPLTKDVLGIVATLGKVNDNNFSRLLSEYLGMETMLAVVCTTYDGVKSLETYDKEGSVSKGSGLHGLGASIGRPLEGRFLVICLENLRPYVGEFVADDPQRRLDLLKPKLPSGESPPGFLGFAVNMIHVDSSNLLYLTTNGHGLRETLFYHLLSRLQVYKTRVEMLQALPLISHGALSMDGGMIKGTGVFSLGCREDLDVRFPISSGASFLPENYVEIEQRLKEMKWKKDRMMDDIRMEEHLLGQMRYSFEMKKQEFLQFLAQSSPYPTQEAMLKRTIEAKFANSSDKLKDQNVEIVELMRKTNSNQQNHVQMDQRKLALKELIRDDKTLLLELNTIGDLTIRARFQALQAQIVQKRADQHQQSQPHQQSQSLPSSNIFSQYFHSFGGDRTNIPEY